ncbi:hypothetical protein H6P81_010803 [Aristolochia fimbriata]|uniref:Uncharacterized protein n=1 Tax=Aristolochia fimbriata TaxID=158543 RepID=A0AAV7EQ14_ARIFI|nr:hypothetical protein H6P81_010803 [Aristolochia fimbriata]
MYTQVRFRENQRKFYPESLQPAEWDPSKGKGSSRKQQWHFICSIMEKCSHSPVTPHNCHKLHSLKEKGGKKDQKVSKKNIRKGISWIPSLLFRAAKVKPKMVAKRRIVRLELSNSIRKRMVKTTLENWKICCRLHSKI